MEVIMNKDSIQENITFNKKYVDDLNGRDEREVQMLTGSKKKKREIIAAFLRIIKDNEALLV